MKYPECRSKIDLFFCEKKQVEWNTQPAINKTLNEKRDGYNAAHYFHPLWNIHIYGKKSIESYVKTNEVQTLFIGRFLLCYFWFYVITICYNSFYLEIFFNLILLKSRQSKTSQIFPVLNWHDITTRKDLLSQTKKNALFVICRRDLIILQIYNWNIKKYSSKK